jgi:hypothetical protein
VGPIALFDESVWFDHYFLTVIAPYFYIETLADLGKPDGSRPPDAEVRVIAEKTPDMRGRPCVHHVDAAMGNLLGAPVPMDGRIPLPGGYAFVHEGRRTVAWDESPEALALGRWQSEDFLSIEREFAQEWREALTILPLDAIWSAMKAIGIGGESSKTLLDAHQLAAAAVGDKSKSRELIGLVLLFLGGTAAQHDAVMVRWEAAGRPALPDFAPYAAFVLTVEVFFQVALSASLIARERPSNRIDIAYLYYLPFCMVFVSSDNLHRRCAALFLRKDQEFVWGLDLKAGLSALNRHFLQQSPAALARGVITFDGEPPAGVATIVDGLFVRHMGGAGSGADLTAQTTMPASGAGAVPLDAATAGGRFVATDPDALLFKRSVRRQRGSWLQIPEYVK